MNKDKKYRKQVLKGGLEARLALAKVFGPEVALKTKVKVTYHDLKKSGKTSKMNFSTTVGLPKLDVNESQFDMSNYPESEHASKLAKIKFYFPNWNNYGVANTDTSACNGEYDTEDTSWTCIDENAEVEFLTRLRVRGTTRSSSRGGQ